MCRKRFRNILTFDRFGRKAALLLALREILTEVTPGEDQPRVFSAHIEIPFASEGVRKVRLPGDPSGL